MHPATAPFQIDQTKLVEALLGRSKDIGGADPIFTGHEFDQAVRCLQRIRFRWLLLDSTQHASLLTNARFRLSQAANDGKDTTRLQQLVDDLDMASMVDKVKLEPVTWWTVRGYPDRTKFWVKAAYMNNVPLIANQYGAWAAWHPNLLSNYEAAFEMSIDSQFIKRIRQHEATENNHGSKVQSVA